MSNPETTRGPNGIGPDRVGADYSSHTAQQPAAPLTSFTELLGLGEDTRTVCTPDGYCS